MATQRQRSILFAASLLVCRCCIGMALSIWPMSHDRSTSIKSEMRENSPQKAFVFFNFATGTRRDYFRSSALAIALLLPLRGNSDVALAKEPSTGRMPSLVNVRLTSPSDRAGMELMDVEIGTPPRNVVAVKQLVYLTQGNRGVQPGMILVNFDRVEDVVDCIQRGPYPIELQFANLAAGGDAINDMGETMVTSLDALKLAAKTARDDAIATTTTGEFGIRRITEKPMCAMQSRRGDVLEIIYDAHIGTSSAGSMYDSSAQRGTGQPYQFVLGSGDMLPGVDQGLYDMCPGEIRELTIPPPLAYGSRGNKVFRVPGDSALFWRVELVAINSVREGDARTRDEIEGRSW